MARRTFLHVPVRKKPDDEHQFKVGDSVSITLHTGLIVAGTVRAIYRGPHGRRALAGGLRDETALVEFWRVRAADNAH